MPSIKEIMAAKAKAAAAPAPASPPPATPVAVGESQPPASRSGLLLHCDEVLRQAAADQVQLPPRHLLPEQMPRQLDSGQPTGQQIPMDHPPAGSSEAEQAWWAMRHSLTTDLVIWIEPQPSAHAWIAVQNTLMKGGGPLLLLHRLPMSTNPLPGEPF